MGLEPPKKRLGSYWAGGWSPLVRLPFDPQSARGWQERQQLVCWDFSPAPGVAMGQVWSTLCQLAARLPPSYPQKREREEAHVEGGTPMRECRVRVLPGLPSKQGACLGLVSAGIGPACPFCRSRGSWLGICPWHPRSLSPPTPPERLFSALPPSPVEVGPPGERAWLTWGSGCLSGQDVGSNELQSLPASVGGLESLRDLSVRKNQMGRLPEGECSAGRPPCLRALPAVGAWWPLSAQL